MPRSNFWETVRERPIVPPEEEEEKWPICPVCGQETDTIYYDQNGEIVGCGECVRAVDAWEVDL